MAGNQGAEEQSLSALSEAELDDLFEKAREWLRNEFTVKESVAKFAPEISETTIKRVRGKSYDKCSKIVKIAVVKAFKPDQRVSPYDEISIHLGQSSTPDDVLDLYKGRYRYYRFTARKGDKLEYASGRILVYSDPEGKPSFQHRSSNHLKGRKKAPQHMGYVFTQGERLFLAGFGGGTLTMWISETFRLSQEGEGDAKRTEVLHGVSVSSRSLHRDPFAARFILVHDDNKEWQKKLDPKTKGGGELFKQLYADREPLGSDFIKTR